MVKQQYYVAWILGLAVGLGACEGSPGGSVDGGEDAGGTDAAAAEDAGLRHTDGAVDAGLSDATADASDAGAQPDGTTATADAEPEDAPVEAGPVVEQLAVVQPPTNTLARWIDYRTAAEVETDVELVCDGAYEQRFTGGPAQTHSVFAMGLVAGSTCEARVHVDGELVESQSFEVTGPVGWPSFEIVTEDTESMQPGWTLMNLVNGFDGIPARVALVDAEGRLRWYYELPTIQPGGDTEVAVVDGGVLACGRLGRDGPFIIGWDGAVVWQPRLGGHHDCRFLDEEQRIFRILLDGDRCEGQPGAAVIQDLDRETGEVLWDWSMCEHYQPAELVPDWSHVNTIESFPDEDALLLSSREQHALFKVSHDTGEVLWKLGHEGDFAHAPEDAFWAQHAPEVQPNGQILLFDNGRDEPDKRASSRVIEIAYDEDAMTYEVVWEYAPSPARFTPIWGDADRLENGNTLATFGVRSATEASDLYEVDASGTVVWQLRLPLRWGVYRADRVEPLFGSVASD